MAHLSIHLLGSFQVILDGAPVSGFESDKVRALLAYLAVETDHPHRREALAGLLWPDAPERAARTNLRHVLANLRQAIGDRHASPPFLLSTHQTLQVDRESDYWLDVTSFTASLQTYKAAPQNTGPLVEAVSLYQGPFMAEFSLSDSALYEEWLTLMREQLNRQAVEALHHLAQHYRQCGAYEQALSYAWRQLELEPWQEEAHQEVMRLLALTGQRSLALVQYETCRRLLAEGLGVEPAPETLALYEQIRSGELNRGARGQGSRGAGEEFHPIEHLRLFHPRTPVPLHDLPLPLTPLIGRETELAELTKLLADPELRLVTVVGPGGIGKTRLALEAAAAQGQHFADGVYLVSLARLSSAEGLVPALAEAFQFAFYDNTSLEQQLLDYLRYKELLLVLDNFEHLLASSTSPPVGGIRGGADLLITLLRTAPGLKILTTSRARLNVQGEQLYPLAGLRYPPEEAAEAKDGWRRYGALALFRHSARRLQPDFALTEANLPAVALICRLVRGMPLGILLASAWIELLSPGEIAAEIERSFEFLQADLHDLPQRQRSLRAVFEHSWRLLTRREQAIFQQLAIFRGGFSRNAAQAVTGAALADLLALAHKFLLHRTPAGRYEVHELVRQYAAQKLAQAAADEGTARERHSAFYVAFLGRREADLKGPRQREALTEIEGEGENIRLAWGWAVAQGQVEHLAQAVDGLGYFYHWRGRYQEGEAACHAAAKRLKKLASGEGLRVLAKTLRWQGLFNRLLGHSDLAAQLARQSLSLLEAPALADQDTRPEQAAILLELGQQSANLAEARRWFEQSLTLYRSLGDQWGTAQALYLLGRQLADHAGSDDEGQALLAESMQLRQTLGDRRGIAEVLECLGFNANLRGQTEISERLLRQALVIRREMADKAATAENLLRLASELDNNHGRFVEAHDLLEEGLRLSQDLGNGSLIALAKNMLSFTNLHLGRYGQAHIQAQMGLSLGQEIDNPKTVSFALWHLGSVALAEGAYAKARELLGESVAIHRAIGERSRRHDVLACLGYAALGLGKHAQARQCLVEALQTALENRFFLTRLLAIPLAALLAAEGGKPEQAVELYALASRYPFVANSHWFEAVAGRHIAAVAETLPAEAVAAAQARGQARDLEATVLELVAELESL